MTSEQKNKVKLKFKEVMLKVISINKTDKYIQDDELLEFFVENMVGGWDKIYEDFKIGLANGNSIEEQLELMEDVIKIQQKNK